MPNQTENIKPNWYETWDFVTGHTDKKPRERQKKREQDKRDARLGMIKPKKYGTMPKIYVGKNK